MDISVIEYSPPILLLAKKKSYTLICWFYMILLFHDFIAERFKYFLDNIESPNTDLYLKSIIIKY